MIPLYDNIRSRTTPYVNYSLIVLCCIVFLRQVPDTDGQLILRYGLVPARFSNPQTSLLTERPTVVSSPRGPMLVLQEIELPPAAVPDWFTLLTCTFLHGGLLHLVGNLLFLYIFGDNVEDRLGHLGYLVFYLSCGVAASSAHWFSSMTSMTPTIGASGAVAGVMGAYMLLYPHARVVSLVPIFFFLHLIVIPAPIFLGLWLLLQVVQGSFSIGNTEAAGVAWWAHVGGFAAGYLFVWLLAATGLIHSPVASFRPGTERSSIIRVRPRADPFGQRE